MEKIKIEKPFDKHYCTADGEFHWPVRVVQKRELGILGSEMFFFQAEHLDHPLKGCVPDKLIKKSTITVPQEKLSDLLAHLKHDGEFRHFKYHIVDFKLHRKWAKDHKGEIKVEKAC